MMRNKNIAAISFVGFLCFGVFNYISYQNNKCSISFGSDIRESKEPIKKAPYMKAGRNDDSNQYFRPLSNSRVRPLQRDGDSYVYTPNGTSVYVETGEEASQSYISYLNDYGDDWVPEATRIANSSIVYNCHSYAWYLQSTSNPYWMPDPSNYYTDGSYEISTGEIGDIICYFDDYEGNLHSGIVIGTLEGTSNGVCGDADLKIVRSKWGSLGLYEHRGDQCPYTSSYDGDADYVMYFKPKTNDTITLSNPGTNTTQIIEKTLFVPINCNAQNNYALYALNVLYSKNYEFEISTTNYPDVRLYDEHMQLVSTSFNIIQINSGYLTRFNSTLSLGKYYLRVAFNNSSAFGIITTKVFNTTHSHSFNSSYQWLSYTLHRECCSCGMSSLGPHAVSANAFNNGNQYATCLLCGGLAIFGYSPAGIPNNYPMSVNGSFILPNGVVVLVDEDFDTYMDGTLVFIYPNIE